MLARFHRYSFGNCMLIALQNPDATHVAGFTRWKQLGRHVKKGERGIAILAPLVIRRKVEETQDDGTQETVHMRALSGFKVVHVFDVSQTDGKELPEFAEIAGDPGEAITRLESVIQGHDIVVGYADSLGGPLGVSEGGRIQVLERLEPAEKFSVLVHEVAHELLHRDDRRPETTKTIRETEAEAVAFVVCHASGLDCSTRSSDYIQLYAGNAQVLQDSLDHIQRVASVILSDLEASAAKQPHLEECT